MKTIKDHVRYWGQSDIDGGIRYIIITEAEKMTDKEIYEKLNLYPSYGGVGSLFIDPPFIRRKGKYIHISITWGYDC